MAMALAAALVGQAAPASADQATVRANRTTTIYDIAQWMPSTCAHLGIMKHKLIPPPEHGKVSIIWTISRADRIPEKCEGKIKGLVVRYTPNRGYRGEDSFRFSVQMKRYETDGAPPNYVKNVKLTVK